MANVKMTEWEEMGRNVYYVSEDDSTEVKSEGIKN